MNRKDYLHIGIVLIGLALIILVAFYSAGCAVWESGGIKPEMASQLRAAIKFMKKEYDKSVKQYEGIQGNVTAIENRMSKVETTINNINTTISKIETTNNETPFWKIFVPVALFILFVRMLDARSSTRTTWRRFFGIKEKKHG